MSLGNKALAQSTPFDTVARQIRHLYAPIIPQINTSFFYDLAPTIADSSFHNPLKPDTLNVTTEAWVRTYNQFRYAAIDTTWLPPYDSIYNKWLQESPDTISLLTLCFTYKRIKPSVFELNETDSPLVFDSLTEQFSVKPGVNIENYLELRTFLMVAPASADVRYLNKVYKFNPNYFFADPISQSILNTDGLILRWSKRDSILVTNFTQPAYFFYNSSGRFRSIDTVFAFVKKPGAPVKLNSFAYIYPTNPTPINTSISLIVVSGIKNTDYFEFDYMRVTKFKSCAATNYKKALIYVEGLDVLDFSRQRNRDARDIYNGMLYHENLSFLRDHGYDIWVIDWKESTRSMKDNGNSLVEFIDWLKGYYQGPDMEPFVMIGESMGGVIARYALCTMEQNPSSNYPQNSHNIRTLITIDSPNLGANIPLSLQFLYDNVVKSFKDKAYMIAGMVDFYNLVTMSNQGNLNISAVNNGSKLLQRPAVKELLLLHLATQNSDNQFTRHPDANDFWDALDALGNYPTTCKLIAQANGALTGAGQKYLDSTRKPGDLIGYVEANIGIRLFGKRIPVIGAELELRTNKEGDAHFRAFRFDKGAYTFKIRFRRGWFHVEHKWRPAVHNEGYVNAKPYCVRAGSTQNTLELQNNYNAGFKINLGVVNFQAKSAQNLTSRCPSYFNLDLNVLLGIVGAGTHYVYCTDGPFFSFIPVMSAIGDADGMTDSVKINYWDMPIADKLKRTPHHAFMGPSFDYDKNKNFEHLHTVNSLTYFEADDKTPDSRVAAYFQTQECKEVGGFFLNKEIGTNNLFLNNVVFNYNTTLHVPDTIFGDRLYRHTEYNDYGTKFVYWQTTTNSVANFGLYSKAEPAITTNGSVIGLYTNETTRNKPSEYGKVFTGLLDANTGIKSIKACCNFKYEYAIGRIASPNIDSIVINKPQLSLYPNPLTNSNILRGKITGATGIFTPTIVTLTGKTISLPKLINSEYFTLDLSNLKPGVYKLLILSNDNKILTQTFIKQ